VDAERFEDIEAYGVERWLGELTDSLRNKTYQPQALRRAQIPKPNGKLRPLSIPTIRDRTAMMAATLILAPIFEADLPAEQHGYREERSALSAVQERRDLLVTGRTEVIDADLTDYFGSIPHAPLMKSVARRIADRHVLHLIKMWLEAPVEESDDQGRTQRTTRSKDTHRGIPQGSPISPLLSNLYMRRLVLGWKHRGYERRFDARRVTYADDLGICCRNGAPEALQGLRQIAGEIGLTINEDKTRVCQLPEGRFDFAGILLRTVLLRADRPILYRTTAVAEEHSAYGGGDHYANRTKDDLSGCRNDGAADQPAIAWVGELLSPRSRQQIIPGDQRSHRPEATSVVV
jgi:group II intron reverse transcriptase/maturase